MKVIIDDADVGATLDDVRPGDRVTVQAFVQRVEVEAIDVTELGQSGRQVVKGETTINLVIVRVDKVGVA